MGNHHRLDLRVGVQGPADNIRLDGIAPFHVDALHVGPEGYRHVDEPVAEGPGGGRQNLIPRRQSVDQGGL